MGQDTPLPSIELSIDAPLQGSCDSGDCFYVNTVSWRNETTPNMITDVNMDGMQDLPPGLTVAQAVRNSFRVSVRIRAGTATRPEPSVFSSWIRVTSVDSRSEAVISSTPSSREKRKLSRIGSVFLLLITLLMACRWLNSSMLETTNFI